MNVFDDVPISGRGRRSRDLGDDVQFVFIAGLGEMHLPCPRRSCRVVGWDNDFYRADHQSDCFPCSRSNYAQSVTCAAWGTSAYSENSFGKAIWYMASKYMFILELVC